MRGNGICSFPIGSPSVSPFPPVPPVSPVFQNARDAPFLRFFSEYPGSFFFFFFFFSFFLFLFFSGCSYYVRWWLPLDVFIAFPHFRTSSLQDLRTTAARQLCDRCKRHTATDRRQAVLAGVLCHLSDSPFTSS